MSSFGSEKPVTSSTTSRVSLQQSFARKQNTPSTSSDDFDVSDTETVFADGRRKVLPQVTPPPTLPEEGSLTSEGFRYECTRCLREFDSHERHKYEQHVAKCKD